MEKNASFIEASMIIHIPYFFTCMIQNETRMVFLDCCVASRRLHGAKEYTYLCIKPCLIWKVTCYYTFLNFHTRYKMKHAYSILKWTCWINRRHTYFLFVIWVDVDIWVCIENFVANFRFIIISLRYRECSLIPVITSVKSFGHEI